MATQRSRRRRQSRDYHAADVIVYLCEQRAWGTYDLARATAVIAKEREDGRFNVSRRTLDRVLSDGAVPQVRVRCAVALALDVEPWRIWGPGAMALPHQMAAAA